MSASARSGKGRLQTIQTRLNELRGILSIGMDHLKNLYEVYDKPRLGKLSGTALRITNKKNTTERALLQSQFPLCIKNVNEAIYKVGQEWKGVQGLVFGENATKASQKNALKELGQFCVTYLKLWSLIAGFQYLSSDDDCKKFQRVIAFGKGVGTRYYEGLMESDSAIQYFIGMRNKVLLEEEVEEVIGYMEAVLAMEDLRRFPSPPSSVRGGGRATRRRRRGTRAKHVG